MGVLIDAASLLHAPQRVSSPGYAPMPEGVLAALAANDAAGFHAYVVQQCLDIDGNYVWTDQKSGVVCLRSLSMIAAFHAATDVLQLLLSQGADVLRQAPDDGSTALHCACSNPSQQTTVAIKMLLQAGARLDAVDKRGRTATDLLALETAQASPAEDDMQQDCYRTDDFRMYRFKVELCQRLDEQHDWTTCPFMHPGEKARRRDPRMHKYNGVPCPDFRKGSCKRADGCTYAHGVFECWLHPARYRTQLCKEGALCKRSVCFFAHSMDELREPLHLHGEEEAEECGAASPGSPKGPLVAAEPSQDSSRASSPDLASRDSARSSSSSSTRDCASSALRPPPAPDAGGRTIGRGGRDSKLRASTDSMRSVLSRQHSICGSAESSLSCTPVLDGPLGASLCAADLARSLSGLSLVQEETVAAATAAATAAVAALNSAGPPLGQGAGPAACWGLGPGLQVPMQPNDMLSLHLAAVAGLQLPLGGAGLLPPDQAAVLQAAALQQRLAMAQVAPLDSTTALLAAAGLPGIRQPLQALNLNLAGAPQLPAPFPSCLGL